MKNLISYVGLILVLLIALLSASIITLLGWQRYQGKLSGDDAYAFVEVLVGKKRYALSVKDINDLNAFRAEDERLKKILAAKSGGLETQIATKAAKERRAIILQQNYGDLMSKINDQKSNLKRLRESVEALKHEQEAARTRLIDLKKQSTSEEIKKDSEKVSAIFVGLEPDDLAKYLQTRQPEEAARNLKLFMQPGRIAEVLTEMERGAREKILPLMENQYAGWSAEKIKSEWLNATSVHYKEPQEMIEYIKRMNPTQAFHVYFALPSSIRKKIKSELERDLPLAQR